MSVADVGNESNGLDIDDESAIYDVQDLATEDAEFDDSFSQPIAHYYETQSDSEDLVTQADPRSSGNHHVSYRPPPHASETTATSMVAQHGSTRSSPQKSMESDDEELGEEQEDDYPIGSDHEDQLAGDAQAMQEPMTSPADPDYQPQLSSPGRVRSTSHPRYRLGDRYTHASRQATTKSGNDDGTGTKESTGFRPASKVLEEMIQSAGDAANV